MIMRKLFFAIAAIAIFSQPSKAASTNCGKAEVVKGDVKINAKPLAEGEKVCQGDEIKTAADSRAKLVMEDGNVLNVNPSSGIKIESYANDGGQKKKVLLNVMYGKMRATVNQKYDGEGQTFQVKTKSAVAGVRGTDFLTAFEPKGNKMQVVTFEGKVEVGKSGPGGSIMNSVMVGPGQKTEAGIGAPPAPPKAVPASELKEMNGSSMADGNNGRGQGEGAPRNENGYNNKEEDRAPSSVDSGALPPPMEAIGGGEGDGPIMPVVENIFVPPEEPKSAPTPPPFVDAALNSGPAKVNVKIEFDPGNQL
jgi:hypothetical protein